MPITVTALCATLTGSPLGGSCSPPLVLLAIRVCCCYSLEFERSKQSLDVDLEEFVVCWGSPRCVKQLCTDVAVVFPSLGSEDVALGASGACWADCANRVPLWGSQTHGGVERGEGSKPSLVTATAAWRRARWR